MHPIRRRDTPSDRVYRDGTGVARRIGCSASCSEPGGYFEVVWLRLMLPLGCVGRNCPQLYLSWAAVHPIRRHDTRRCQWVVAMSSLNASVGVR